MISDSSALPSLSPAVGNAEGHRQLSLFRGSVAINNTKSGLPRARTLIPDTDVARQYPPTPALPVVVQRLLSTDDQAHHEEESPVRRIHKTFSRSSMRRDDPTRIDGSFETRGGTSTRKRS